MKTEKNYYDTADLIEISKRGYYPEKINFIMSYLEQIKKNKGQIEILDVASNDGYLASQYAKYGNITANEINEQGAMLCREKGIPCISGDFFDIDEKYYGRFDVVIVGDIIEHIFDTDAFLQKASALLKNGGVLLLTTTNLASLGRRIMLLFGFNPFIEFSTQLPYKEYNVGHIRYYTKYNLMSQLKFHHFSNIKIIGDRINFIGNIHSKILAKLLPSFSRYFLVYSEKK